MRELQRFQSLANSSDYDEILAEIRALANSSDYDEVLAEIHDKRPEILRSASVKNN